MSDTESPRVYVNPGDPGAPQPGDVVVVMSEWATPGRRAWLADDRGGDTTVTAVLLNVDHCATQYAWLIAGPDWVHSVRQPTEAELAAWALSQGTTPADPLP